MKNIILQGLPGIGKTTLITKISEKLKSLNQEVNGFYTEEVRSNKYRIGFDVVTLEGKRGILARKSNEQSSTNKLPKVGQYAVQINDFEKLVLPVLKMPCKILIVDEIGKMESYSKEFEFMVKELLLNKSVRIVATVPIKGGPFLVKQIKEDPQNKLITVNESNRDQLLEEILNMLVT